jgi:hypothetical protein
VLPRFGSKALLPGLLSKLGGSFSRCDGRVDAFGGDQASLLGDGTRQQCLGRDVIERRRVPVGVTSGVPAVFSLSGGVKHVAIPHGVILFGFSPISR